MENLYSHVVNRTLTAIASTATTDRGIARAITRHPREFRRISAKPAGPISQPWLIDRLQPGDKVELDRDARYGYRWAAIEDSGAASRAEKSLGKCGQKRNCGHGIPQVCGKAHQARFTSIVYKGAYKGYTGSYLHWDYQSCVGVPGRGGAR